MNRIHDIDGLVDQISETAFRAQLARFDVGRVDEASLVGLSMDALDTAEVADEYAIAAGDAATAAGSVDRPPANLLAGQFRGDLSRQLTQSFEASGEAADLLRAVGSGLAQLVKSGRDHRAMMKSNEAMAKLNADLRRRLREATAETDAELAERFADEYPRWTMEYRGSIVEEAARNSDLSEREALDRGVQLDG